jgi:hypothetical protein
MKLKVSVAKKAALEQSASRDWVLQNRCPQLDLNIITRMIFLSLIIPPPVTVAER